MAQLIQFLNVYVSGETEPVVVELRTLASARPRPETQSGYYSLCAPVVERDALVQSVRSILAASPHGQPDAVYLTLNPVVPALLARANGKLKTVATRAGISATDRDVIRRRWLLIDVDPVRPAGISATDEEKAEAIGVVNDVRADLDARGWPEPMVVDSGNGYHLWYRIDLPTEDESVVERVLKALAAAHSTDAAKVDTSVFNPSRIAKLPGTWARKGDHMPDRPHRMAKVLSVPDTVAAVEPELLRALAAEAPSAAGRHAPPPTPRAGSSTSARRGGAGPVERCRAYLDKVEPAVSGQGGHDQTYEAARIIWNDFGIDDPDGWALLCEFNTRCQPPWSDRELWHKWESAVAKGPGSEGRGSKVREREAAPHPVDVLGWHRPPSAPPASPPQAAGGRPNIIIGPDEYRVNDEAVAALAADPEIYSRGGQLVRVVAEEEQVVGRISYPAGPRIVAVSQHTLRERLTLCATWQRVVPGAEDEAIVAATPPQPNVMAVLDRGVWPGVRQLVGMVEYPVFLPDGSILATPGYDQRSGLLYAPRCPINLDVPDRPTEDDVRRAVAELLDVVREFPFAGEDPGNHYRAAWLAALLTPVARFAFRGPAPLFLNEGNVPGCGKGLLADTIAIIVRGAPFTVVTMPDDRAEFRKLVTSLLVRGSSLVLFDNVAGSLGGPELDALLTSSVWEDRVLGATRTVTVPIFTSWYATGNNLSVLGDTLRRVCPSRLESSEERPEERTDIERPDLRKYCTENRPRLLSAALIVLRAYDQAGRPSQKLPGWGSFEQWSDLVRNAVVWSGQADPWKGRESMREDRGDERIAAMGTLMESWQEIDKDGRGLSVAEIVTSIDDLIPGHHLRDVLATLVGGKPGDGKPDNRSGTLGRRFQAFAKRTIMGRRLVRAGLSAGRRRWEVDGGAGKTRPAPATQPALFDADSGGPGGPGGPVPNPSRETENQMSTTERAYLPSREGVETRATRATRATSEDDDHDGDDEQVVNQAGYLTDPEDDA